MPVSIPHGATRSVEPLALKALYTVAELVTITGLTRSRVLGLLHRTGVERFMSGRTAYVPLSEIRSKLPPLWRQIDEVQRVLRGDVE